MKTTSTQQEILLVTGTSFSSREFCETSDGFNYNHLSEKEKLEVACWNGLLPVMLPEIFNQFSVSKKLYLWEIREGASFIELELGDIHLEFEKLYSIDPYSFLPLQIMS
ncbi:MAG: hypothetical protein M3Z92_09160 [Bacteroidota bacterium]|nr:hypothetical protein [Bacteroidota bacterium]MDQ6890276.1 hypothetical protein [Bacteroidota bacterium]